MASVDWTAENDRKLLMQLAPPAIRDGIVPSSLAQYIATMFPGATATIIARRILHLRGEKKASNGPMTAAGTITPATRTLTRDRPPPGLATPTRPRGSPRHPEEMFRSPLTGQWFFLHQAPNLRKRTRTRTRSDSDGGSGDDGSDDDEGPRTPAPKRLKWNIHDDYAHTHRMAKQAGRRARVLATMAAARVDIIDLVTPTTATSTGTASTFDRP